MANAYTDTVVNYTGELLKVGNNETPLLNAVGGLTDIRAVQANIFATSQTWTPGDGEQTARTEADSMTAPETIVTRAQETNVLQIMQYGWNVSYSKEGNTSQVSALPNVDGVQPVTDERAFQESAKLAKMQKDLNYTLINGLYVGDTNSSTARKSRGLLTAITTNAVDGSTNALDKAMVDSLLLACASGGVMFGSPTITLVASALNMQKLNGWYVVQERSNEIGGSFLKVIATPFGYVNVLYDPMIPDTSILVADIGKIGFAGKNIAGKGVVFSEPLAQVGAGFRGQLYGELGIDYDSEKLHGKLYNFTSV